MSHVAHPGGLRRTLALATLGGALAWVASGCGGVQGTAPAAPSETELQEADGRVALEDVAILLPLPTKTSRELAWPAAAEVAPGRALLPRDLATRFPLLQEDPSATYDSLHVVAVRLDPCAPAPVGGVRCEPELRFVIQPVVAGADGEPTTHDAAVHLAYRIGIQPFLALLGSLLSLQSRHARSNLGVHSGFAATSDGRAFGAMVRAEAHEAAAAGQLVQATFMTLRSRGNEWQFGGVDITREHPLGVPIRIFQTEATVQSIVLQETASAFSKSVFPLPSDTELLPLFGDRTMRTAPAEDLARALRAANRTNNPNMRTSEDTDCVSCHTAHTSASWAAREIGLTTDDDRYVSPTFDLSPLSPAPSDVGVLRAFGYQGRLPVVSPRTVHEAAKAARQCNWLLQHPQGS